MVFTCIIDTTLNMYSFFCVCICICIIWWKIYVEKHCGPFLEYQAHNFKPFAQMSSEWAPTCSLISPYVWHFSTENDCALAVRSWPSFYYISMSENPCITFLFSMPVTQIGRLLYIASTLWCQLFLTHINNSVI